ncbi:winged helix-turn-helix transcriptional regulator [Flavobacterium cerinum]|uniref:Transcriptional regulator n=1 Tax=Flavobacterium cerinum TaxID=2502784 RepID=A0A444HFB9_9FLAO|nr:helix-turn-helix domain-containing protein [Flavobacterium cerinum]RWX03590.1 transcriptional regulator [Flavobacterium cerinum]
MRRDTEHLEIGKCMGMILPVRDALDVLNGKWKLPILISLTLGKKRFGEMAKEIPKITDRMLSKELRDLEMHGLVKRTVYDTIPVVVEYSLTEYGYSLDKVIEELRNWGIQHRQRIINGVTAK